MLLCARKRWFPCALPRIYPHAPLPCVSFWCVLYLSVLDGKNMGLVTVKQKDERTNTRRKHHLQNLGIRLQPPLEQANEDGLAVVDCQQKQKGGMEGKE